MNNAYIEDEYEDEYIVRPWVQNHPYVALLALLALLPVYGILGALAGLFEGIGFAGAYWREDWRGVWQLVSRTRR